MIQITRTRDPKSGAHLLLADGVEIASAHQPHVKLDRWSVTLNGDNGRKFMGLGTEQQALALLDRIAEQYVAVVSGA